jgi:hypothetical protein
LVDTLSPASAFTTLSFSLAFFIMCIDSCRGSPWVSKRFILSGSQPICFGCRKLNRPLLDRWRHSGIHASKQQTQIWIWLQLISQCQSVHCRSWLLLSRFLIFLALGRGARVRLTSAAYRFALNVGLSETLSLSSKLTDSLWGT